MSADRPTTGRRRTATIACLLVLSAGTLAACGDPDPEGPGSESGQYAGIRDGLGALIDFGASDRRTKRIADAMEGRSETVAVVSIVNRTDELVGIPTFTAHRVNGLTTVLARADRDPRLRAAGLPEAGSYVPARGALTVYLLLPGSPADVTAVAMRSGLEREVRLQPQRADGVQPRRER